MWPIATIVLTVSLGAAGFAFLRARRDATFYKSKTKELTAALNQCREFRKNENKGFNEQIKALNEQIKRLKNIIKSIDAGGPA